MKPEIIGIIIAKKEPNTKINNDDSSDKDGNKPSSEKKLKIDESFGKIILLMPCPFTGPKMFCAGPNFLSQPKNLTAFKCLL